MNLQSLNSKLNFLKAQRDNYYQCGHFSEEEIEKLQKPITVDIEKIERQLQTEAARNINTEFEIVKA